MKRAFCFIWVLFSYANSVFCQGMTLQDPVTNKSFSSDKYAEIKGTPFFFDKWIAGSVTVPRGTYKNLSLKFDVYNNSLLFTRNDESYEFQEEVISFILSPKTTDSSSYLYFKKGVAGNGLRKDQYVQVLAEGKANLYRSDIKMMSEVSEINRGVVKSFATATRYFVETNNSLKLMKLNKADILEILSTQQAKVQEYADQHKLSYKKEADITLMVKYYNSL